MQDRCRPRGIERWLLDFVSGRWFAEVGVVIRLDERIVADYCLCERTGGHRLVLVGVGDSARQFCNGIGGEEPAVCVDVWRLGVPVLTSYGSGIEDRPNRPAAV